jgi:hypothetical protein
MSGPPNNGREDSSGSVIPGKACLHHPRSIVYNQGTDIVIHSARVSIKTVAKLKPSTTEMSQNEKRFPLRALRKFRGKVARLPYMGINMLESTQSYFLIFLRGVDT